jgi:hypothetical protein
MGGSDKKRSSEKNGSNNNCLPVSLSFLTDRDRNKFHLALEVDANPKSQTYGQSFLCVQSVLVPNEEGIDTPYDLKSLFTVPLRTLCKNLGIANCGSKNKFELRKAIALFFTYQDKLEANGLNPSSHAGRLTSTLCRAINVVFSEQFIESFKTVNDLKNRRDHETRNTNKHFWINAAMAHNFCGGSDSIARANNDAAVNALNDEGPTFESGDYTCNNVGNDNSAPANVFDAFSNLYIADTTDPYLQELNSDPEINLLVVTQFDTDAFRKKITDLFHVRRIMKENMTASGTHDSDPWNFIEAAMHAAKKPSLTKLGVYYFYVRCEEHPDMDSQFQPFLDSTLLGDTVQLTSGDENEEEDDSDDNSSLSSGGGHCTSSGAVEHMKSRGLKRSASSITASSNKSFASHNSSGTKKKKKTKLEKAAEHQQLVVSALTQSQDEFREFMKKQDAFMDRMITDADKRDARANLQFRLDIAKAMGNMDELQQLMEEARRL